MPLPPPRRLVVAAADPRLTQAVQAHLTRAVGFAPPVVRFDDVPHLLAPDADGDILLVAAAPADAAAIETVVREAKAQQYPAGFALLECDPAGGRHRYDHLAPYLSGRWAWPQQAPELAVWARQVATAPGPGFADPAAETAEQTIRRRLAAHTPSLVGLVEQLGIAAAHEVTVLIEGETGTGKTFLAKLVHDCSARRNHRFLAVACGALSGNLIAGEFFGHVKGAFTGADAAKVGKFAAAGEGTILLDEIDTLGMDHQANLLRVIETGEYEPVGSNETQVCRARIVAASNWDLAEAVERGTFRRDLYYRLHVLSFHLPPLRHRPEDIGRLARGMAARYGTKFGKRLFGVCPEAVRVLEAYPWPGNIRQLENVVQQAVLTCAGSELKAHHLPPLVGAVASTSVVAQSPPAVGFGGTLRETRAAVERANILRALEKAGQSRTRAARLLGISRVTLYKKMDRYGLLTRKPGPVAVPVAFADFAPRAETG
ncbi:MAG: sigma 54-interacting transcriptional regulator [Gemmataceae bacterium]|nr:sigma 54-interacting transcriptional regulator [Gemmataceae bacterium]